MLILGLDFETSGLDPKVHAICEVGAQLWDTDYRRAVQSMGYLIKVPTDTLYEEEAVQATGLTPEILAKYGKDSERALKQLLAMYQQADIVCAHNGNRCDRPFLLAWIAACGFEFDEDKFWLDTLVDIEYPNKKWNRQLTCLAAYHNFLNPFPHQALGDVMTMLHILDLYPLENVLAYAKTPWVGARLTIPFENNQWGKDHGYFSYYKDGKFRFWMKKIKEDRFEEEDALVKAAGFSIAKIEIPEDVY